MFELKFKNPVFHSGENFTVRVGGKWVERIINIVTENSEEEKEFGSEVQVMINGTTRNLTRIGICRFDSIPQEVFEKEHDPVCRTPDELLRVLREIYGEVYDHTTVAYLGFDMGKGE